MYKYLYMYVHIYFLDCFMYMVHISHMHILVFCVYTRENRLAPLHPAPWTLHGPYTRAAGATQWGGPVGTGAGGRADSVGDSVLGSPPFPLRKIMRNTGFNFNS